MSRVQSRLIPFTIGLLGVVAVVIMLGTVIVRLTGNDASADERPGVARNGNATLGVELEPDLRVAAVVPGGPGEAAGIKSGDQLLALNGDEVKTIDEARTRLAAISASTEYTVSVQRQGAHLDLKATKGAAMSGLGALFGRLTDRAPFGRDRTDEAPPQQASPPSAGLALGVSLEAVTGGVRVLGVTPNSAAAAASVQVGDVIVSVNGRPTPTVEALQAILRTVGPGSTVPLVVKRGDREMTLTAQFGPRT